jgi:hypothetical protein
MDMVEQYHTHIRIVNGYKLLPIPISMGIKFYLYSYLAGIRTHWAPDGYIKLYKVTHNFTFIDHIYLLKSELSQLNNR